MSQVHSWLNVYFVLSSLQLSSLNAQMHPCLNALYSSPEYISILSECQSRSQVRRSILFLKVMCHKLTPDLQFECVYCTTFTQDVKFECQFFSSLLQIPGWMSWSQVYSIYPALIYFYLNFIPDLECEFLFCLEICSEFKCHVSQVISRSIFWTSIFPQYRLPFWTTFFLN